MYNSNNSCVSVNPAMQCCKSVKICSQIMAIILIFLLQTFHVVAQEQDEDMSYYIDLYHTYAMESNHIEAAHLAYKMADFYDAEGNAQIAKKYYGLAAMHAQATDLKLLEADALFNQCRIEWELAEEESGDKRLTLLKSIEKNAGIARQIFERSKPADFKNLIDLLLIEGQVLLDLDKSSRALQRLRSALEYAQKSRYMEEALDAATILAELTTAMGMKDEALLYSGLVNEYRSYFKSLDSLETSSSQIQQLHDENVRKEVMLQTKEQEIEQKQNEILLKEREMKISEQEKKLALLDLESERNTKRMIILGLIFVGAFVFFLAIALIAVVRSRKQLANKNEQILLQQSQIVLEKQRSDKLLHNILPAAVAAELKENGRARPLFYEKVSILFTDFKGFTSIASRLSPEEIVEELEVCFTAFDGIIEKYNLEKIKTMGDGYMAAGGIPIANQTNPIDAVKAAIEMQRFMRWKQDEKRKQGKAYFELRIGIHTGPVVAGVVGKKKFAYDVWGDSVNLASRMESSGEEGKVNISRATFEEIQDHFFVTYRGRIDAKNKGFVDMYFVEGARKQEKAAKKSLRG